MSCHFRKSKVIGSINLIYIFFLLDGNLIDKDTEFLHWMM